MKSLCSLLVFLAPVLAGAAGPVEPHVAGEVLVTLRPAASESAAQSARDSVHAVRLERVAHGRGGTVELLRLPGGASLTNALGLLRQHPAVASAEPNFIYTHDATP